jgi:N-carbamoyl-L-amino-acid hydrolase
VFAGGLPLDVALDAVDRDGVRLGQALDASVAQLGIDETRPFRFPMHAYLEAHIEQGPVLEISQKQIGIVTGIQGLRWFEIEVIGEEGHAGTVPMAARKDAVAEAASMVVALRAMMADQADKVRFNVGRFEVTPNSPNTIPGGVLFTIDFRHPEAETLQRLGDLVEATCRAETRACDVVVREIITSAPTLFDPTIRDLICTAAERQDISHMELISGATHDAKYMADLYRAGMIFVPCENGVSHNEAESATPEDLVAGARVLAEVMIELANE